MRYAWDLKKDGSCCEWSDMLMNSILEREREYNIKNNANLETVLFPVWRWEIENSEQKMYARGGSERVRSWALRNKGE